MRFQENEQEKTGEVQGVQTDQIVRTPVPVRAT